MNILHIHQDYPDGRPFPYTKAVSNLVTACRDQDDSIKHTVLSINRTSNPLKIGVKPFEDGISVVYWAIPIPYLFIITMWFSSWLLCKTIKETKFDLIHGHKLTTEGVMAYLLAKKLNIPYTLSIRGGSDKRNLSRLSAHRNFFAKIYNGSSKVFWVSPWAKDEIESVINTSISDITLLPNICEIDLNTLPKRKSSKYLTAVSFHQYKRKGVIELIQAISILKQQKNSISLDIYGSGDLKIKELITHEIEKHKLTQEVSLKGQVNQEQLRAEMSHSKGFILPAHKETFGMTYIEALSVGCPIIYMANTGIDGYFDTYNIGVKLKDQEPTTIADAILYIEKNSESLSKNLSDMLSSQYLAKFTKDNVAEMYLNEIRKIGTPC